MSKSFMDKLRAFDKWASEPFMHIRYAKFEGYSPEEVFGPQQGQNLVEENRQLRKELADLKRKKLIDIGGGQE